MHSFTSNFDGEVPVPRRSVGATLLVGMLIALGALTAWEIWWRAQGQRPMLQDSAELWTRHRQGANEFGERALAVVGSSRFQLGIEPNALSAELPEYVPIHLAIDASPGLPVLRDLANDPNFTGSVLFEVTPTSFFARPEDILVGRPMEWIAYRRTRPFAAPLEFELRKFTQEHLAFVQPGLNPRELFEALVKGRGLPKHPYLQFRSDRYRAADYSLVDTAGMTRHWADGFAKAAKPPSASDLQRLLDMAVDLSGKIRSRGGEVVFFRMISSGPVLDVEEQAFPRARYWQRLTDTNVKTLHFEELKGTEHLGCAEGSHLDHRAARTFTQALASELRGRKLLPRLNR